MPKYPYRVLGSLLDRIFRNNINDNFTDIQSDLEEQKGRVDNLIVSNPQPSEVQDARGSFPVLRDRLNNVDSSLAVTAKKDGSVPVNYLEYTEQVYDPTTDNGAVFRRKKDTTQGYVWQTSYSPMVFKENGEVLLLDGKPMDTRKKLVIIGSSVCYGQNATNLMGYANKLKATLESRGWFVTNHAIPGNATQDVINRWFTDVVPERPDFVYIGLSLGNENIQGASTTADKAAIYNRYRDNMLQLIRMTKQLGAVPVVGSIYPRNDFGAEDYEFGKQMNREIETWDVYQINLMGNVDNGTGHFINGMVGGDGLHPTDAGYQQMYNGIPTTIFENLTRHSSMRFNKYDGYIQVGSDTSVPRPMEVKLAEPISSFTAFFKLRDNVGTNTKVFFGFGGGASDARLRNSNNYLEYYSATASSPITSTLDIKADKNSHDIALSYCAAEQKVRLYIDGVLVGSTTDTVDPTTFLLSLGSASNAVYNANGCDFKDFLLYRVKLSDNQIAELSSGHYLKSSLEIYAPLSDKTVSAGRKLLNLAPTNSYLVVNSPTLTAKTPIKSIS